MLEARDLSKNLAQSLHGYFGYPARMPSTRGLGGGRQSPEVGREPAHNDISGNNYICLSYETNVSVIA